jgi:hypothetical protein
MEGLKDKVIVFAGAGGTAETYSWPISPEVPATSAR